ncbi:uncharacterized protein YALI1_C15388g [Yarrowia lipolytica]|uniref:Uncharacterized protein n=1 Tax=Yarrowia lipolytica TaxID=4952 RepID=A0A1D8NAK5_YARLL|nr:hypothetical protein YALI1_C15388g [Yarrowia lipolytica]
MILIGCASPRAEMWIAIRYETRSTTPDRNAKTRTPLSCGLSTSAIWHFESVQRLLELMTITLSSAGVYQRPGSITTCLKPITVSTVASD